MTSAEQIRELEIEACLALKQGRVDSAERSWQGILIHARITRDDVSEEREALVIHTLRNILVFAVRNHKEFLLENWLMEAWNIICLTDFYAELGEFVNGVVFAAMDKKMVSVLPKLQVMFKQYLRLAKCYEYPLDKFTQEWLSTTAEIASRGLSECSLFLVQGYLRVLYMQDNLDCLFKQIWEYNFHYQAACQRSGFEKAYQIFGLMHYLEIIFAERIAAMPEGPEQHRLEKRFYRGICDLLCNIAKVTGRSEKDILATWKQLVTANELPKTKERFEKLYKLELKYWQEIKPKSYQALGLEEEGNNGRENNGEA